MINTIYINEMKDVFGLLNNYKYISTLDRYRSPYLYRGLSDSKYHLETSLQRNSKNKQSSIEKSILRNFAKYVEIYDEALEKSIWKQMILGQHHGLPTRLLDWTYSPLIGLNFAVSEDSPNSLDKHDCILWKINIEEINQLLPYEYKKILHEENAIMFTVEMLDNHVNTIEKFDRDIANNAMLLLEPPSIDQRIVNQYSYFSIIPLEMQNIENFLNDNTNDSSKFVISKDLRWEIRDFLDQQNISERTMFPGLDGLSKWLKRYYYVK